MWTCYIATGTRVVLLFGVAIIVGMLLGSVGHRIWAAKQYFQPKKFIKNSLQSFIGWFVCLSKDGLIFIGGLILLFSFLLFVGWVYSGLLGFGSCQ